MLAQDTIATHPLNVRLLKPIKKPRVFRSGRSSIVLIKLLVCRLRGRVVKVDNLSLTGGLSSNAYLLGSEAAYAAGVRLVRRRGFLCACDVIWLYNNKKHV